MRSRLAVPLLVAFLLPLAGCLGGGKEADTPAPAADGHDHHDDPVVVAPDLPVAALPHHPNDGTSDLELLRVPSRAADGHQVPISIYKPKVASESAQVPVILHSHGFAGTRESDAGAFSEYVAAGFGVVSIDMRGHGEAKEDSEILVHNMEYEIQDVLGVIDHVAALPWVYLDGPGDPRLGAIGGSYGGGYQLLTAAIDDRLDALAPEITWNDLPQSLAPNGVPKSAWIDLLYAGGNANGNFAQTIHEAWLWLQATNTVPDGSEMGEPDIMTPFTASSPKTYPEAIDIPVFFYQGMPDTLFNFNQAAANYLQVKATGADVMFYTHLNGHILSTAGTVPDPPVPPPFPIGLQPGAGPNPCGEADDLFVPWFESHLIGLAVELGPEVCFALDDESTITGTGYPLPGTLMQPVVVSSPLVVPQSVDGGQAARATLLTADKETILAGIPHIKAHMTSPGPDAMVFFTLQVVDAGGASRVLDSQVTPFRVAASGALDLDLMGVGARLLPGESLLLVASGFHEQFAHNSGRVPGAVLLEGVEVTLPVLGAQPVA